MYWMIVAAAWLLPRPRAEIEPISTSVFGKLSIIENRTLPISAAERDRGPLFTGSLELRQRNQRDRCYAFLTGPPIDEGEAKLFPPCAH